MAVLLLALYGEIRLGVHLCLLGLCRQWLLSKNSSVCITTKHIGEYMVAGVQNYEQNEFIKLFSFSVDFSFMNLS